MMDIEKSKMRKHCMEGSDILNELVESACTRDHENCVPFSEIAQRFEESMDHAEDEGDRRTLQDQNQ